MARARNIKPSIFKNEVLGTADPLYTLLFESLWLLADREGRLEDRPLRIKAETFPYRDGVDVEQMLSWLADNDFIARYSHGKNRYIQICNFCKHQNPHKNEPPSIIPEKSDGCTSTEKIGTSTVQVPNKSEALGLIPDSLNLIPDSGLLKSRDDAPAAATPAEKPDDDKFMQQVAHSEQPRTFGITPDWRPPETFAASAMRAGVQPDLLTDQVLEKFRNHYTGTGKRTAGQWVNRLVDWLKREKAAQVTQSAQARPVSDGPGWMALQPFAPMPPKVPKTPEEMAEIRAKRLRIMGN